MPTGRIRLTFFISKDGPKVNETRFKVSIKKSKYLNLKCLSVHIGSQITSYKPYEKTLGIIKKIIHKSNHKFEYIDLGGGMGITYENEKKLTTLLDGFVKSFS